MTDPRPGAAEDLFADKLELLERLLAEEGVETPAVDRIPPREAGEEPVLSFAQQRMWFLAQWDPRSPSYLIAEAFELRGRLAPGLLRQAVAEVVSRHEVLRTAFVSEAGRPRLLVAPHAGLPLPVIDLEPLPEEARRRSVAELTAAEARRPFDLAAPPLLRLTLLRRAADSWVLLVTLHHIVADGWSIGVLIRETLELYGAAEAGTALALPALPVQYADFAAWQRRRLAGEELERQLAFWRQSLDGAPEIVELPTDRPRPALRGARGRTLRGELPAALAADLRAAGRGAGASLFMVLLASWQVLLARHAGQRDFVIGTPIANRTRPEIEGLIGFFANTLALRTCLGGDPTFGELLARVRDATLEAYDHQDLPFERLVEELRPARSTSHAPLFQVMLAVQDARLSRLEFPGLAVGSLGVDRGTAKLDLTLGVEDGEDGLRTAWELSTELFDEAMIDRLRAGFATLLEGLAVGPEIRVFEAPLLPPAERRQILEWAGGTAGPLDLRPAHRVFEARAAEAPERPAVAFDGRRLTYRELDRRANAVARRLRAAGVGPGSLVGLLFHRSLDLVTALLGVLKAGGAYVPLDPDYPAERLAFVLGDARPVTTLAGESAPEKALVAGEWRVLRFSGLDDAWEGPVGEPLAGGAGLDDPAYVIYTSGSTGRPKGVIVRHAEVARLFAATDPWFGFGPDDVWTLFHSYAFDFSVWELWGALLYGGRLVVVPYAVSRSPQAFYELLASEGVTVLNQTPSAFRQLIQAEEALLAAGHLPVDTLRFVVFGGEALELQSLAPWLDRHGEDHPLLVNMYGITETTVHVTWRPIRRADLAGARSVVGRPIPDLAILLLDAAGQLVPMGVGGEILVGGAGLSAGYLHRPELTAERFVPHPFPRTPGERLYRSGDLARRLPDGDLEYLGRIDHQVKIRGFRIEPGEIEAALVLHPEVREALVLARREASGEARLVAYVVPTEGAAPGAGALRRHLAARLPEHQIPAAFVSLPRFPLTPEGKVSRRALPEPGPARPDLGEEYAPPRTFAEEVLAAVWAQVLGLERVGIHDNFFALGGDSILSVRVLALAAERGLGLQLHQIFHHQTVAELAPAAAEGPASGPASAAEPFSLLAPEDRRRLPAGLEDAYPLTRLQAGMLFHMALHPEEPPYHNVDSWHLRAPWVPALFDQAVQRVVARHPVLRTSFDLSTYGEPLQLVHRSARLDIRVADLRGLSAAEQEAAVSSLVAAEKRAAFDLARAPQLRFRVQVRSDESVQLTLVENHAIFDGWSLYSTLAEIGREYLAALRGEAPPEEPAPAVSFRDFVALERAALASPAAEAYWLGRLRGGAPTEIPGWPEPAAAPAGRRSLSRPVALPATVSDGARRLSLALAVPLKSLLLAVHVKVLALISGQPDVVTGLTYHGRPEGAGGERVRGLFLNTVPFRLAPLPGSWRDLVLAVFAAERELMPHRRFPMAEIQRRLGGTPLFETAFNFIHFHVVSDLLRAGEVEVLETRTFEGTNLTFQAHFSLDLMTQALELTLEIDSSQLPAGQADRLAALYAAALERMTAAPEAAHDGALLLPAADLARLGEWSEGEPREAVPTSVQILVARQAERAPEAVAVVHGERALSYADLEAAVARLARRLRAAGVGPESRVAVFLDRSPDLVVALLAVLRAGGAFVPLDPEHPDARLGLMIEDSGAALVLTRTELAGRATALGARPLLVEDGEEVAGETSQGGSGGDLAYVLYTSGSTGRPKGVMVSHASFLHYLGWCVEAYRVAAGSGAPVHSPVAFDLTLTSLFAPLLAGRTVELVPAGPGVDALAAALRPDAGFSLVKLTPAHLDALAAALRPGQAGAAATLVIGGEALRGESLAFWRAAAPQVRCVNEYGPTETVVGCCVYEAPAGEIAGGPVPIGRPIASTRLVVAGPLLERVPPGTPGELLIGGGGVARGYLGRPDLTAERFVPDPFSPIPGARLYRTGDRVRYRADSNLELLGRLDGQVKVRGHRIEPGEVEAVLGGHPEVREVAVALRGSANGPRLVAYVVPRGAAPEAGELRAFARARLPEPMVPSVYVILPTLPLTPNGKVDRAALPEPEAERGEASYTPPATPFEEVLAAVWADVFGLERVGATDDFFSLGGHSLLAMRIVSRLRPAFGVEISLRELFEHPTVAALAARVEGAMAGGGEGGGRPPIEPAPRDRPLPLSFAQQRLWFVDRFEPASAAYNLPTLLRVRGPLDVPALATALAGLAARHEVLRTAFVLEGAGPAQVVRPAGEVPLGRADLSALPPETGEEEALALLRREAGRPFDLAAGEPLRAFLARLGPADHLLLLTVHHIASDAWSADILLREALALYEAAAGGSPTALPPLPVQYTDYAVWQRQWLQGEALAAETAFWKARLAGAPLVLDLPADRPRPALLSEAGDRRTAWLSPELTRAAAALARSAGATLFMTLLAAFEVLLARLSGQRELTVGTPVAGRTRLETEGLIGFFVNALVLRADLRGAPSVRALLGRAREEVLETYSRQDLPFEKLVEELRPERSLHRSPLFQVVFVLQNARCLPPPPVGLDLGFVPVETGTAKFDLTLLLEERDSGLGASLEIRRDLFDAVTGDRMLAQLCTLLEGMAADPERGVDDLPLLAPAERHQLTTEQPAAEPSAAPAALHRLFEARAAAAPAATALVWGGERVSYGELNRRANRLARHLRALGVGLESRVALCLERSPDLVVALLAVLKAGGAYVPLEPGHPEERLAFVLADSATAVLVTTAETAAVLPPHGARTVLLDGAETRAALAAEADGDLPEEVPAEALAYIIYTSGSTGSPKGTLIPHAHVCRLLTVTEPDLPRGPGDVWTLFHSYAFDFSVWEIWGALAYGGSLVLVPYLVSRSPADFRALLLREKVTVLNQTPSAFRQLVALEADGAPLLTALRAVVFGGEALDPAWLRPWVARYGTGRPRLINMYGITETTVHVTVRPLRDEDVARPGTSPVGRPIADLEVHVLDAAMAPVPIGAAGEMYVGGPGLARGYLGRPDLTAARFVPHPFSRRPGERLYRSGDLARLRRDGELEFVGRADHQVKVRGFRIELGEIEAALAEHPRVGACAVLLRGEREDQRLIAYLVLDDGPDLAPRELRAFLSRKLPEPMLPAAFVRLAALPLTANGKLDRRALPEAAPAPRAAEAAGVEGTIQAIWREVLELSAVGRDDNFFDLGGHSLLLVRVQGRLREALGREVEIVDLFRFPTVRELAGFLAPEAAAVPAVATAGEVRAGGGEVAIVGLSGRFPGAPDLERFWANLRDGVESISRFSPEELLAAGHDPALVRDSAYVPARAVLEGADLFDALFFGYSPREAEILNPQQRLFLESAWTALEDAGYVPDAAPGRVGVFAGTTSNGYWLGLLAAAAAGALDGLQVTLGNEKDFLATRVSYELNLKGPSVAVQTACSTSLVAVHLACRSLLAGECDMALAGGVTVMVPQKAGYLYQEGGIASPDGHCRAFDAGARGTVSGDGVGVVVLKRLADALADGDAVHAVIRGSALTNDGAGKVGYTAPGPDGQAGAIRAALAAAGVEPAGIDYVEAHGTGTPLGDPVEVAALRQVFAGPEARPGTCGLGSLKTNVGHLDAAAGVAGLIKTVLAMEHGSLPPSLHFERLNPRIDLAGSPFYVNGSLRPWPREGRPRRAGVSSFGIGGTNAHVVLEEAPERRPERAGRPGQLLVLSARSAAALDRAAERLADHLERHPDLELADVAFTLQKGRKALGHRRAVVARDLPGAVAALRRRRPAGAPGEGEKGVAFLFPGQGAQRAGMGRELYAAEAVFCREVDRACEILHPRLGIDLRELLFSTGEADAERLSRTVWTQPALFVVEHALARLWMSWGVQPRALIGHSVGEYVAACLAGVFELEAALDLVAERGRLMQELPAGAMLSVPLAAEAVAPCLGRELDLAAVNGPGMCVVSGPPEPVAALERELAGRGVAARRLRTSHAFHSAMMDPILAAFARRVRQAEPRPPRLPFLSNLTGTWIRPEEAADPEYWARHLRGTVRFEAGLRELLRDPGLALLEVGPGRSLSALAARHPERLLEQPVVASWAAGGEEGPEALLAALGELWQGGAAVDWSALHGGERRLRVPLPTYPFERQRYWIEASPAALAKPAAEGRRPLDEWFYLPAWKRSLPPAVPAAGAGALWLLCQDGEGLLEAVAGRLERAGERVERVLIGEGPPRLEDGVYRIDPARSEHFAWLLRDLSARGLSPDRVVHGWAVRPAIPPDGDDPLRTGFHSLLALAQALGAGPAAPRLTVVSSRAFQVSPEETVTEPERAAVAGLCRVVRQEAPGLACRHVDVAPPASGRRGLERQAGEVAAELLSGAAEPVVAWRGGARWIEEFEPAWLPVPEELGRLREGGVYLITGGLGDVGSLAASLLARRARARLALVARTPLPPREAWAALQAAGGEAARRVERVLRLEALGAEVMVLAADAEDPAQLAAAAAAARERWGEIHGIVHAAGERAFDKRTGRFDPLPTITHAAAEGQVEARRRALEALAAVAREHRPDFCLVMSSLAAVVGLLGSAAYPAGHALLDAFAQREDREGEVPWIAVDWDNFAREEDEVPETGAEPLILRGEAEEALLRVLALEGVSRLVVSTVPLGPRLDRWMGSVEPRETPAGAARRNAHPRPDLDTPYAAPRTEAERRLAAIWEELLGIDGIGVDDSFLALGGDSVISIQMLARARQAGLHLTPRQVFELQTVAELAAAAGTAAAVDAEQGLVAGPVPLTPIQRWFFGHEFPAPEHWNQSVALAVPADLDPVPLEAALSRLLLHHDALRHRFRRVAGEWRQEGAADAGALPLARLDLSGLPVADRERLLLAAAEQAQRSLDLEAGPLLRALLVDLGRGEEKVLLLIAHHLVVDAVSWRVLIEDLETVYVQLRQGRDAALPAKTTSFRAWALRLEELARSSAVRGEMAYWTRPSRRDAPRLPVDTPGGRRDEASAGTVRVELSEEEGRELLRAAAWVWSAAANEVLLAAVVRAFAAWTGEPLLLLDVEGHGREAIADDLDLSRTVGWLTAIYPVEIDLRQESGGPGGDVRAVARQLREIPGHGLGYGLLRHLGAPEDAAALRALPPAEVSFLYLGQLGQESGARSAFRPAQGPTGPDRSPEAARSHLLDIKAGVFGGRLEVFLTYSPDLHRRETVAALAGRIAAALRALLAACRGEELPGTGAGRSRIEELLLDPGVEAVYPASALQHGMLFHSLESPQAGLYVQQLVCTLAGELDAKALEQAWGRVIARHPVLRTSFVWNGLPEPLQVVHREIRLPFETLDWRGHGAVEAEGELERLLAGERRAFDLYSAPLLRLTLALLAGGESRLVWTYHHALLDGWSVPLVLGEVFATYKALLCGREPDLPSRRPFADYIGWLRGQDHAAAERFWRPRLAGFRAPSRLGILAAPAEEAPGEPRERAFEIPVEGAQALRAFARRHQITQNTLVQAAWGLLLSHLAAEPDVVYGTVVSGRSAPLDGIEAMIGAFVNTLPVRVRVGAEAPLLPWLRAFQENLAGLQQAEHTPLVEIQGWSEVPRHQPLFESMLAFESYPVEEAVAGSEGMRLRDIRNRVQVSYPLVAEALPRRDAGEKDASLLGFLQLRWDPRRIDEAAIARLGAGMVLLLSVFSSATGQEDLRSFLARLTEADRRQREERGRRIAEDDRSTLKGMRRRAVTGT